MSNGAEDVGGAKGARYVPGYAKYSVATMSLRHTEGFPDEPNPGWPKKDIMVSENDITRIFEEFKDQILRFENRKVTGPTSFGPHSEKGIRVYFDPNNLRSLFIVAETEEGANRFVRSLGESKEPYHQPRERRERWYN